jgi:hypothetical protein
LRNRFYRRHTAGRIRGADGLARMAAALDKEAERERQFYIKTGRLKP